MRVLLDTNVLIDGIVNHPGHETFVSPLSQAELRYGIMASADAVEGASREARFDRLKASFGAGLPFDDTAAMAYGAVMRQVIAHGRNPKSRIIDLMIAATAVAHNTWIVTRNTTDFAGLESLVTIIPA